MNEALDDIRFLADSRHRAVAMEALASGPRTRAELREATGASSATVGRIVAAFEERGWLVRERSRYALTTLGLFVAERFATFHRDMETAHDLHELVGRVPLDEIGIGIDRLTDAHVTRRTRANPFAILSRVRELERRSTTARSLTDFFPEPCIDGRYQSIVNGDQTFEAVFAPGVIEAAMASDSAAKFEAIVAAERAAVHVYDGEVDYPVMVHDGVGCLVVRDDENISVGMIESADEAFVAWVNDVYERHLANATPLTPARLGEFQADALAEV